ncbi:MAG: glycosyltransferase family 39 protein [Candidatus Gastranaerophilaceae bacterium]
MKNFLNNMTRENKLFVIFLILHVVVWTCISLIRVVMPTDTLEGIYWGSLHDFGTPKHPPLAAWLTYLAYLPFKIDFCVYLLSQIFIVLGFIYIYKFAKFFLADNKAFLSVILMEGCWVYSYITSYYGFNPDVVLLLTLPAISYYFYKTMKTDSNLDWLKLSLFIGFSCLGKYQTVFLLLFMLIWALKFNITIFKRPKFYIMLLISFLIFLPHLVWLYKYDFFPLFYFDGELTSATWLDHIIAPVEFVFMQLIAVIGVLVIFVASKLRFKSKFEFAQNYSRGDFWFLMLIGLGPLALHILMGIMFGGSMRPRWGYEFLYMLGILLFAFIPFKIEKKEFNFIFKLSLCVMSIIFVVLATLYSVEKNFRSRYPVSVVANDLKKIWADKFDTPLKYVGGYIEYTLPLTIYDDSHPENLLDTHCYKNPWLDENDVINSGAIILMAHPYGVVYYAQKTFPHYIELNYKIKPEPFKFTVYNAFKMKREYTIYYGIIPPRKSK